ncbi:hypothetical protein ACU4GH_35940 [Bradyrhizobium betae]
MEEACEYLKTSRGTPYRWIDASKIAKPTRRDGRAFYRRDYIKGIARRVELQAMDDELGL